MFQRALKGKEKALGSDHASTLSVVSSLGDLYVDQDRLDEAEMMYQRAVQGYEKALGSGHTSTLEAVNNLRELYVSQGRLDEAEEMNQRTLSVGRNLSPVYYTSSIGRAEGAYTTTFNT